MLCQHKFSDLINCWRIYLIICCSVALILLSWISKVQKIEPKYLNIKKTKPLSFLPKPKWYFCPAYNDSLIKFELFYAVRAAYFQPIERRVILTGIIFTPHRRKTWKTNVKYTCVLFDQTQKEIQRLQGNMTRNGLLLCESLPKKIQTPAYVNLQRNIDLFNQSVLEPNWKLEIVDLEQRKLKRYPMQDIAICTGPLFGNPNKMLLLQFLEFYRIKGIKKVFMPIRSALQKSVLAILHQYLIEGFVELSDWRANFTNCLRGTNLFYCSQEAQNNDCLLRNTYKYKYIIVSDFDELIMPINQKQSLVNLLDTVDNNGSSYDKEHKFGLFLFPAMYHITRVKENNPSINIMDEKSVNFSLPIWSWTESTDVLIHSFCPKSIVKPEAVKEMHVHQAKQLYPGYIMKPIDGKKEAFMHHYKNASSVI